MQKIEKKRNVTVKESDSAIKKKFLPESLARTLPMTREDSLLEGIGVGFNSCF
jgi:hypothetical protein